jgi:zinc protease
LTRTKAKLVANTVYARDNQGYLARSIGTALTTGVTVDDVLEWPVRVEAVTLADVEAAAARTLDLRRSVTGILLPTPGAPPAQGEQSLPSLSNSSQQ